MAHLAEQPFGVLGLGPDVDQLAVEITHVLVRNGGRRELTVEHFEGDGSFGHAGRVGSQPDLTSSTRGPEVFGRVPAVPVGGREIWVAACLVGWAVG